MRPSIAARGCSPRRGATPRPGRRVRSACSSRPALSPPTAAATSSRRSASCSPAAEARTRWQRRQGTGFDAFDAKAEALAILAAAGAPVANLQVMGEAGAAYHPGQSGTLRLGPKTVLARIRRGASRDCARRSTSTATVVAAEIISMRSRRSSRAASCARLFAARAAAGDARLRLPRAGDGRGRGAGARRA